MAIFVKSNSAPLSAKTNRRSDTFRREGEILMQSCTTENSLTTETDPSKTHAPGTLKPF